MIIRSNYGITLEAVFLPVWEIPISMDPRLLFTFTSMFGLLAYALRRHLYLGIIVLRFNGIKESPNKS